MANWTGTYTITNGATGISTGGNSSTELRNTGATWPTGAQSLANFTVRILTGTGAGQSRIVTSNTATVLTVPAWTVTPDATSTYEIVLIFNASGSDHIVAAVTLSTNIITEIVDSSTLLFDGLYLLSFTNNCIVRWGKTLATMPLLCANNRTVQGKVGFVNGVQFLAALSMTPQFRFIKMQDTYYGVLIQPSTGVGDGSTISQIWIENAVSPVSMAGAAMPVNMKLSGFYWRHAPASGISYPSTLSAGKTFIAEKNWAEWSSSGPYTWSATGATTMIWRDSVAVLASSNRNINIGAGQTAYVVDNYFSSRISTDIVIAGASSVAGAGTYVVRNNRNDNGRSIYGAANSTASIASAFNDLNSTANSTYGAFDIAAAANYVACTSDSDYIAGTLLASPECVDTTMATTSTASPAQYKNLTSARTNARSTPNKPFTMDNIVIGTPTGDSVTITFDCANGVQAGHGSTNINADSSSGQTALNVVDLTGFAPQDMVEIGHGTARAEVGRVASVTTTLNLESNLTYTHTAAQADTVKKQLRHDALPQVRYGLASGIHDMASYLPDTHEWGLLWAGFKDHVDGHPIAWKREGHSVTLVGLLPETTYYFKVFGINPLGEVLESAAEYSFTTAANTRYTNPGEANLLSGITFLYNNVIKTGTFVSPTTTETKHGVAIGPGGAFTGSYRGADLWSGVPDSDVRAGVGYIDDGVPKTGRVVVPPQNTILKDEPSDTDGAMLGTLVSTTAAQVRAELDANSTQLAAIKAKTDNLPSDPGDESNILAAISALPLAPDASTVAAAVLAAAATTPISADVKKVNGAGVLGNGTASNLWRGA